MSAFLIGLIAGVVLGLAGGYFLLKYLENHHPNV